MDTGPTVKQHKGSHMNTTNLFIIFDTKEDVAVYRRGAMVTYRRDQSARAQATKLSNRDKATENRFVAMPMDEFTAKHNPMVTVKSLMTGADVQIRKSEVGGPCDPSMERYWSM